MRDDPAAVMASTGQVRTMADGSLRISIEIEPRHAKDAFALFGAPGTPVALARVTPQAAVAETRREMVQEPADEKGLYGAAYTSLFRAGFWFAPAVQKAFGVDEEVEMLRERDADPKEIVEVVKNAIYIDFSVSSLSHIEPGRFREHLHSLGVEHLLPRDFP